jgi:hypothetical protein
MKKVVYSDVINFGESNLPINVTKNSGCFVVMLSRVDEQLKAMLSYHCQVLVLRLDLHMNNYSPDNSLVSKYMKKLKKKLIAKYALMRVGHVWAREREKAKSQHYHLVLMIDANKVRHPSKIIELCESIWMAWEQPKPYTPKNCYSVLKRGDKKKYDEVFRRISYLAKERGKGYKAKTANDYSTSRIKVKGNLIFPNDFGENNLHFKPWLTNG